MLIFSWFLSAGLYCGYTGIWSKPRHHTFSCLSLAACLVTWSQSSYSYHSFIGKLLCVLQIVFTLTLQSCSSPSCSWLAECWCGHSIIVIYLNVVILNLWYVICPNKPTCTCMQCSYASVGLAQAYPSDIWYYLSCDMPGLFGLDLSGSCAT